VAVNVTLLAFAAHRRAAEAPLLLSAGRAATDRYLLPAGPTAANPPHTDAAVDRLDRQTDGPYRYIDPAAYYASSVNNCKVLYTDVMS